MGTTASLHFNAVLHLEKTNHTCSILFLNHVCPPPDFVNFQQSTEILHLIVYSSQCECFSLIKWPKNEMRISTIYWWSNNPFFTPSSAHCKCFLFLQAIQIALCHLLLRNQLTFQGKESIRWPFCVYRGILTQLSLLSSLKYVSLEPITCLWAGDHRAVKWEKNYQQIVTQAFKKYVRKACFCCVAPINLDFGFSFILFPMNLDAELREQITMTSNDFRSEPVLPFIFSIRVFS